MPHRGNENAHCRVYKMKPYRLRSTLPGTCGADSSSGRTAPGCAGDLGSTPSHVSEFHGNLSQE